MTSDCVCLGESVEGQRPLVVATPEQVLDGMLVGLSDLTAICTGCQVELREGQTVTVYAYRCTGGEEWSIGRCYCSDCAPHRIQSPTLGVTEVIAAAALGVRSRPGLRRAGGTLGSARLDVFRHALRASRQTGTRPDHGPA